VTDTTEPYFIVDASYANKPRKNVFYTSCAATGSSPKFYTTKTEQTGILISVGAAIGIAIGAFFFVVLIIGVIFIIIKERKGEPLFMPLTQNDHEAFGSVEFYNKNEMSNVNVNVPNNNNINNNKIDLI
jgi:hypothetical protein